MNFRPYENNRNLGTLRGKYMLEESFEVAGAGRGAVSDRNGVIIAGNHAFEMAKEKGLKIKPVKGTGKKLVAIKRKNLKLGRDKIATTLAYTDNRTAEINRSWDKIGLLSDYQKGIKLDEYMPPERLTGMARDVEAKLDKEFLDKKPVKDIRKIRLSIPQDLIDRYNELAKGDTPEEKLAYVLSLVE